MPEASPVPGFGTCRRCGDAVPPGATRCPICGEGDPIRAGQEATLTGAARRRYRVLRWGRTIVVVGVVVLLAALMVQAAVTPAPVAANPLSQTSVLSIPAGKFAFIQGWITGADYIQGNYTVLNPPGALLGFAIYNSTEFPEFDRGLNVTPMDSNAPASSGLIVYAALYSDTYTFVWQNQYPSSSNLTLKVYVTTAYETNVVVD